MIDVLGKTLDTLSVEDLTRGYVFDQTRTAYCCMHCGRTYERGVVYRSEDRLLEAEKAAAGHVAESHGGPLTVLLELGKGVTGISDTQAELLRLLYAGFSDRECAKKLGDRSPSTIRNHRFQLRKRRREAKVLLAVMDLVEARAATKHDFVDFHGDLRVQDERTIVTREEAEDILEKAFESEGSMVLRTFPRKQKAKLVVLNRIVEIFEIGRRYTEKEVNRSLALVYEDYVTLRRYLIEYGFMARHADGSEYWRLDG